MTLLFCSTRSHSVVSTDPVSTTIGASTPTLDVTCLCLERPNKIKLRSLLWWLLWPVHSLYTGDLMEAHLKQVVDGGPLAGYGLDKGEITFGSRSVSPIMANLEDRNRTAPFPFCGNRFEFRAVGSSQDIGYPLAILNTAYAESMEVLADAIEANGGDARAATADMLKEHWRIIFNGNGYSEEWAEEAARRGLPNLKNTVDALDTLTSEKNENLFESQQVFSKKELHARQEIAYEAYTNALTIEANTLLDMMETGVIPA